MPQISGQLQNASVESLSADPTTATQGRIYYNTTTSKFMIDDGTNKLPLLRNDSKLIIGTSGTAGANIRLNRAGTTVLQFVAGGDVTAEGSLSTALAQVSFRVENYTTSTKPAAGNIGRMYFATDTNTTYFDNGTTWIAVNPMTTGGDLIYGGASGVANRLANGSANQILTSSGGTGAPFWATPTTVAVQAVTTKTAAYTATTSDNVILCSGSAFTVTLYTAVGNVGKTVTVKKTDAILANIITVATSSSQTIDGLSTYGLYIQYDSVTLVSDGANWQILDRWLAPVKASYYMSTNTAASSSSPYNFDSKIYDTAGSVSTAAGNWRFICTAPGIYNIKGFLGNTGGTVDRYLWKNGAASLQVNYQVAVAAFVASVQLTTNDYIDLRPNNPDTGSGSTSTTHGSTIHIERLT